MWFYYRYRKRILFSGAAAVVFLLAIGAIVLRAKSGLQKELSRGSAHGATVFTAEDIRRPPSWVGSTVSFAAAAGYQEKEVWKIELFDGLSGQTVVLSSPEEVKGFFRIFDGVSLHPDGIMLTKNPEIGRSTPIGVTVWQGDTSFFFVFGNSELIAPYDPYSMLYLSDQKIGVDLHIRRRYGLPEESELCRFGETDTFAGAAGYSADGVEKIDLCNGSSGRKVTLESPEEIRNFLSAVSEVPVTLKTVGIQKKYAVGVTLYQGGKSLSFSFDDGCLNVPAELPGGKEKIYSLTLPENFCNQLLETYRLQ